MKAKRFQYSYRKSASKLHRKVGDTLRTSALKNFDFYQEYPVNKVNPDHPSGRHKFDWVSVSLRIVIEVHGKQHYVPVDFGGKDAEKAVEAFKAGQIRDNIKAQAARDAGYGYIVVPYTDEKIIDEAYLVNLISTHINETSKEKHVESDIKKQQKEYAKKQRAEYKNSDYHQQQKENAKKYRQQQYQKSKEYKNEQKNKGN